jgi:hypothetical protein
MLALLNKEGGTEMTGHAPISYTDEQKRALRRSWSTCTARELDKLALSAERCIQKGAFARESAKFLRELLAEMRVGAGLAPPVSGDLSKGDRTAGRASPPPTGTADVIAELRAAGEASRRNAFG